MPFMVCSALYQENVSVLLNWRQRDKRARELWDRSQTDELRHHLRVIYPHLFAKGRGMAWQKLGDIQTDAHRRLGNPQAEVEWLTEAEQAEFLGELRGFAKEMGYKPGWAAMKYRERFGEFPTREIEKAASESYCSLRTRLWIKSTMHEAWRRNGRQGPS
jgi:hypothetical protein